MVSPNLTHRVAVSELGLGVQVFCNACWWDSQISSVSTVLDASLALRVSSVGESRVAVIGIGKSSTFVNIHVDAYILTLPDVSPSDNIRTVLIHTGQRMLPEL